MNMLLSLIMPSVCIQPAAVRTNAHSSLVTKHTRYILNIEYEYAQLCVFSLALQAAINRNSREGASGRLESGSRGVSTEEEGKHLRGTVRAARTILRTVLDDLLPRGSLTYIPVRSYSRLLGATLILLKVITLILHCQILIAFFFRPFFSMTLKLGFSAARPASARST
jgi:hypothetical protein